MSSSDRPRRPSARPSARPPLSARAPVPQPSRTDDGSGGGQAGGGAKAGAARVSARRGAPEAGGGGDARRAPGKAKGKPAKPQPKRGPVAAPPVAPPSASVRPPASTSTAAHDDGDDVFSAAEPHADLVAGLSTGGALDGQPDEALAAGAAIARLARGSATDRRAQEAAQKGVQSLLSSDYYERQYGAHGMRSLSADVDDYGLDPHAEERARPWLELLSTRYFRLELEGAERVPPEGRALLVANRSGSLPWDGLMLRTALRMRRPELQPVRWLSEDSVIHYPFLGVFMNRLGAVRACPENAERLLGQDRLVAVFPEGAQGSNKLFRDRYRLQRFGRGGYVKLALKLGAPILPTAIIGAEETNPLLARLRLFGRNSGDDFVPITPTFPWLGPAGLLPAPVKWRVIIGDPVDLSAYGPEAAEDALVVHRLNEQIRSILQALLDQGTASRRSVLFG